MLRLEEHFVFCRDLDNFDLMELFSQHMSYPQQHAMLAGLRKTSKLRCQRQAQRVANIRFGRAPPLCDGEAGLGTLTAPPQLIYETMDFTLHDDPVFLPAAATP